jgi:hypothetical protein
VNKIGYGSVGEFQIKYTILYKAMWERALMSITCPSRESNYHYLQCDMFERFPIAIEGMGCDVVHGAQFIIVITWRVPIIITI